VHHAIAEAHGDQAPQRQRSLTRADILQSRGQRLLDAALVGGREPGKLGDAVAEHQGGDQGGQQHQAEPNER
jgi:hypothetical protein